MAAGDDPGTCLLADGILVTAQYSEYTGAKCFVRESSANKAQCIEKSQKSFVTLAKLN